MSVGNPAGRQTLRKSLVYSSDCFFPSGREYRRWNVEMRCWHRLRLFLAWEQVLPNVVDRSESSIRTHQSTKV